MTQYLRSFIVLLVIGSSGLAGCGGSEKEDMPAPAPTSLLPERTAFLTQATWIMSGSTSLETMNGVTKYYNLYTMAPLCLTDNTMMYQADKTYVYDEGLTRCNPTDPQTIATGVWEFNADGSELTLTHKGASAHWKIVAFTATNHVITRKVEIPSSNITRIDTLRYRAL